MSPGTTSHRVQMMLDIVTIANALGFQAKDILGQAKHRQLSDARAIAMVLLREKYHRVTLEDLGKIFNRHYTTLVYATRKCKSLSVMDRRFRALITDARLALYNTKQHITHEK